MRRLRDYQSEDVEKIFEEFKTVSTTLYVAATGLGKTVLMTEVAKRMQPGRTLLLAHRTELITQAKRAFESIGMGCDIEKAEQHANVTLFESNPVVIASVQTLLSGRDGWNRMQSFDPKGFALVLYDESHHAVSDGNKSIVKYFTEGNPALKCLGVTATPDRLDEEALGQIFETVASERDLLWARDNGWLVDIEQYFIPVDGLDFSEMRTTCGDLNGADLAQVMESESCVQGVVQPTLETLYDLEPNTLRDIPIADWPARLESLTSKHRAIVFTVSVAQAEMLCNIFNRVVDGVAAWVCGKTKDEERADIFQKFKASTVNRILVNCAVTTEGYDNPAVDTIVVARPTKSRSLYTQMIGRGTRPVPGLVDMFDTAEERIEAIQSSAKRCVTVLDFVGNSGKHKLISTVDVLAGNYSDEVIAAAKKSAEHDGKPVNMRERLLLEEERLREMRERQRIAEEARKNRVIAKTNYTRQKVSVFDVFDLQPARERGWDKGKTISEKMGAMLKKIGVDPREVSYAQAGQLCGEQIRRWKDKLCSFGQAKVLKRYGYETKNMKFSDASGLMDSLAKNGWKRPEAPVAVPNGGGDDNIPF